MKKLIILIFFLFSIFSLFIYSNRKEEIIMPTISYNDSNMNYYQLDFEEELLNFRNFKLKLGLFTSYQYNITKVYIDYNESVKEYITKEYFSFDSTNFNNGIKKVKDEYNVLLKKNYLYEELDKDVNDVKIRRIDIYAPKDAINKFKLKFPNVKIKI